MLLTKSVNMHWNPHNKEWYEYKGYVYTKMGDEFEVNVEDLSDGCGIPVVVICDGCGEILTGIKWQDYKKCVKISGEYYCSGCANRLFGKEKRRRIKLAKSESFERWCYKNLSTDYADKILLSWDYSLNKISPKDVSYGSRGFNGKGYWFKCLKNSEHNPELKSINDFTGGHRGSINCNQCNKINETHPEFKKYLKNKEDAVKYSFGSHELIPMICPDCGWEGSMNIKTTIARGFICKRCSDGIPYSEKFLFSVLEQLDVKFKTQLSKTTYEWCGEFRYDFYIYINLDCIVETHGNQHYEETSGNWAALSEIQEIDRCKEQNAKENNIKHYVVINCRYSKMEWIKSSIMSSELPSLLNFTEDDVNWVICHQYACSSLIRTTCELWNKGFAISNIAEHFKMHTGTIREYLKQGVELGWCDYNSTQEAKTNLNMMSKKNCKRVKCLTTGSF